MHTCNRCGGRIIFRMSRKDELTGQVIRYRRPFPVHLDGPCAYYH